MRHPCVLTALLIIQRSVLAVVPAGRDGHMVYVDTATPIPIGAPVSDSFSTRNAATGKQTLMSELQKLVSDSLTRTD